MAEERASRTRRLRSAARRKLGAARLLVLRARARAVLLVESPKQYVFVVSSGRSGSTLVQGLLNAMPGVLVRGENSFYVLPFFHAHRGAANFKRTYGARSKVSTSAFYGMAETDPRDYPRTLRHLVIRQLIGKTNPRHVKVLGFKEVRWEQVTPEEFEAFFTFFEQLFPHARYVLNERDPETVINSGQWLRVDAETARGELARGRDVRTFLRDTRPDRVYETTFEVITGTDDAVKEKQLRGLAEFVLGTCDEQTLGAMRAVLDVGHGPFPFGAARKERTAGETRA
ncbi:MAG: sulfotransferase [Jatrophihabitantaceae bacterium]